MALKKGGGCGCNSGLFNGGSALQSENLANLSKSAYYPLNSYNNDPKMEQLSTRMESVPNLRVTTGGQNFKGDQILKSSQNFKGDQKFKGGKKSNGRKHNKTSGKKTNKRFSRKMKGGLPYSNFMSTFGNAAQTTVMNSNVLGTAYTNPPGFTQNIMTTGNPSSFMGYSDRLPYLV